MSIKSPPKKCPVCQSTRFTVSKKGAECKRCGYTNKTSAEINKELEIRKFDIKKNKQEKEENL